MMYHMTGGRSIDPPHSDPDYCHYATKILLPLLMQLEAELQGVVKDDDIEYVHRSRVATRRIRAAFPLFAPCFPSGKRKKWEKQVQILTRSLGEARDLDVQIAYVQSVLDERNKEKGMAPVLFSPIEPAGTLPSRIQALTLAPQQNPEVPRSFRTRISHWFRKYGFSGKTDTADDKNPLSPAPRLPPGIGYLPADPMIPGLECLLLRLVQRRRVMQPDVASTATEFINQGTIRDFSRFLHDLKIHALLRGEGVHSLFSYEKAYMHIMGRIADIFWYEPYLGDPDLIEKHHAMRIMAKWLRYTLEAYADLFDDQLKKDIKGIKKLQELLGDIHDCDVWVDILPRFLEEEEGRSLAYFGTNQFFELVRPAITMLIDDRTEKRKELFDELCQYWDHLKDDGFWDSLSETISVPVQTSFSGEVGASKPGPVIIALISDVHANLPALEAVLADAESRGAAVVLNAGDMTGYGPFPDEVVSLIRNRHVLSVVGNYDLSVLSKKWKKGKPRSREKQVAMRWAYHNLSGDNRVWLKNLPRVLRLPVRGLTLLVTHGSPDSITEYLDDGTPEVRLREVAAGVNARVVVTGHSHRPSAREIDGVWFVNTGSVGRSEDGDSRACYALITVDPFSLTHIRVPYDISRTVAAIRSRHLPDVFARIIQEGRSLETVQHQDTQS